MNWLPAATRSEHTGLKKPAGLRLLLALALVCGLALLSASPAQAAKKIVHHRPAATHKTVRSHARPARAASYKGPGASYLLMDSDTGLILDESNADLPLHPASLTKVMTLMLTFEALERGNLRLSDSVPMSNHAANMSPSKLGIPAGSSIAVQDAIYAVTVHSSNDIAVALAEKLGGTEEHFATMMNRRAAEIGMQRTRYANASGLHNPQQVSTARDQALLARYMITVHQQYYRYFSARQFTYHGVTHQNHNHLMETYAGMDGLKTGFIQQSGFNLIASAKRNNHRLIGVIFGGRSTAQRNAQMAGLLNQGFARVAQAHMSVASNLSTTTYAPEPRADVAPPVAARAVTTPATTYKTVRTAAVVSPTPLAATTFESDDDSDPRLQKGAFASLTGQGDIDPAASSRLETGLMAVSAVRQNGMNGARLGAVPAPGDIWSIQVGAYSSRVVTDQALQNARSRLPPPLAKVDSVIVPLKTAQGWVFRGRLSGYSRDQAYAACKLINNCTPVSPLAN